MKAKISNNTNGPKGFYVGFKQVTVLPGELLEGDYDDALLQSLKDTGFDVEHEGKLKITEPKASKPDVKAIVDAAKAEADKIIISANAIKDEAEKILADAKAEADKILSDAKSVSDKIIAEAEELTKADK